MTPMKEPTGKAQSQQDWAAWKPANWVLHDGEVHVWRIAIQAANMDENPLSPEEQVRARKFTRVEDRDRFVTGRSTLRQVLGRHLVCLPSELVFRPDRFGRPQLISPLDRSLDFNVSHSGRFAVITVATGRRVGIDVETIRDDIDLLSVMRDLFTPGEQAAVMAMSGVNRARVFFWCWTRKEALVKAIGTGLSAPLATLDIRSGILPDWEVRTLTVGPGYQAAVAGGGNGWRLSCWQA